jgi:coatomer beta subunit-like protein
VFLVSLNNVYTVIAIQLIPFSLGEDALANLSIEQEGENGKVTGFVRVRSRSQGLALALGSLKGIKAIAA